MLGNIVGKLSLAGSNMLASFKEGPFSCWFTCIVRNQGSDVYYSGARQGNRSQRSSISTSDVKTQTAGITLFLKHNSSKHVHVLIGANILDETPTNCLRTFHVLHVTCIVHFRSSLAIIFIISITSLVFSSDCTMCLRRIFAFFLSKKAKCVESEDFGPPFYKFETVHKI